MRRRPVVLLALPILLVAPLLSSCATESDRLTIYSGRSQDLIEPLLEDFAEETGVDIDVRYGDSADLALLIAEEGDRSPADVFLSQSPGAVGFLDQEGLLAELDSEVLDLVPEENRASDGRWVGVSGRVRVLVYDSEAVDPADLPDSVLDLTQPEFEGRVAVAPSNASFQDFVTAMRSELGDEAATEWLDGMAANDSPVYANNTAIVEAVGRGEVDMGLVNHYYNVRAKAEDPDVPSENYSFPNGDIGSLLIVTAASVLQSSDQPEDAGALIEFLLGEEAQRFYSDETFEYPLAAGVEPADELTPIESLSVDTIDFDELGGGLERTRELIEESGIEG